MKILVRRAMALGDVLSITPVITRLRQIYPNAFIVVHTAYQKVFAHNYAVNEVNTIHTFDLTIDLDGTHETRRNMHAVDAYLQATFGNDADEVTDKTIIFNHSEHNINATEKFVAVHPAKSWDNRTMPPEWWDTVVAGINKAGYHVAVLGTHIDYCPQGSVIDTRNQLDLATQAAFIASAEVFICGASGLMVLAGATETPVVLPMTIRPLETSAPYRHGVVGWGYYPLIATTPCYGCDQYTTPGATFVGCESPLKPPNLPNYECIRTIKAEEAIETALKVMKCNQLSLLPEHQVSQEVTYTTT